MKYDHLNCLASRFFLLASRWGNSFLVNISSIHRGLVVRSDEPGGTFKWRLALIWHTLKIDTPLLFEIYENFLFRLLAGWEWPQAFEWLCHPQFQVETKFQHILGFWGTFNTFLRHFWHFFDTFSREQKSGAIFLFTPLWSTNHRSKIFLLRFVVEFKPNQLENEIKKEKKEKTKSLGSSASVLWLPGGPLLQVLRPQPNLATRPSINLWMLWPWPNVRLCVGNKLVEINL